MKEIIIPTPEKGEPKKPLIDVSSLKARVKDNEHYQQLETIDTEKTHVLTIKFFLGVLILLPMIGISLANIGRVASTYFTIYPASEGRAWDSEPVRWGLTNYPITKLVHFLESETDPKDGVMVFRQSDVSYYSGNRLAVYTDDSYAHLFRIKSPVELRDALVENGIKYIAIPGYGLAELNNSAFNALLGSPDLVDIVFEESNERLYQLRIDAPPSVQMIKDFDLKTESGNKVWKATRFPMSLNQSIGTPESKIENDIAAGAVTISRVKPPLVRPELVDVLQPWDINLQTSPNAIGQTDFKAENGIYQFDASIKADGRIQLILELDLLTADLSKQAQKILLWDGVLDDEEKLISGQTLLQFAGTTADPNVKDARSARLYFTMMQGGYLTLKDLNISQVKDSAVRTYARYFGEHKSAFEAGWEYTNYIANSGHPISTYKFTMDDDGAVMVTQTDSAALAIKTPKFILPSQYMEELDALKLNRASKSVAPKLHVKYTHGGYGGLNPFFEAECLNDQYENSDGISIPLPQVSLRMPPRPDVEEVLLPCIPISGKLVFKIDRDVMRIPPDFKFANAKFSDISINVEVWKNALTTLDISYLEANEITPFDTVSKPTIAPLPTDF